MHRNARFDTDGYACADTDWGVRRTLSSWDDAGWRALLVQRFEHVAVADDLVLPASAAHHFWVVTDGAGTMRTDIGDGWRSTPIAPGTVGRALPGRPTRVRYEMSAPMRTIHVHLTADDVARAAGETGAAVPVAEFSARQSALIGAVLRSLADAAHRGRDDRYAAAAAEFLAVELVGDADAPPTREDQRVRAAISYMHDRLGEPIRLADLAGAARLSRYHFLRVFTRETGVTPARYLTRLRVEHAKHLLGRGLAVHEVASACGFTSPGHLSAAFLRQAGVRPSVYRDRERPG
ncbi:helix-turn-helix domain-containing protein [Cryptosporangium japonicum]|uniref:AraC family transcriptional regulator n=1 Tax=Cryptosporangium japonicum TaxID=80872 RepID=A0ABN0UHP3_9ACTN